MGDGCCHPPIGPTSLVPSSIFVMHLEERKALALLWQNVGDEALAAAQELKDAARFRSSVSRSYYAAYSFLASRLVLHTAVSFSQDRDGPEHGSLPDLITTHLKSDFSRRVLWQIRKDVETLYSLRIQADYRPKAAIYERPTLEALKTARRIAGLARTHSD